VSGWNDKIIEEFRANGGKVGGWFKGATLLLLHTTGARTGAARVNPLMYQDLSDGSLAVLASKGGAHTNPDWYYNLLANPIVTAEVGTQTRWFRARVAVGDERQRILAKQKIDHPVFADYEAKTTRAIPVVILDPIRPEEDDIGGWSKT
jgi:deazaflavin-dependent oxidoreductase (nitroreductase family)